MLLNDSLRVDFDRVIAEREVLVVKGALGAMGAGNTSVLMQLLVGMLDAALARQQDLVPADERVAVALKVDEAPLVLNRGFAETMALKRSAGLETVACWQTDAQWTDREVREQLDALFAHRVYFATASARDARAAVALTMAAVLRHRAPGHRAALGPRAPGRAPAPAEASRDRELDDRRRGARPRSSPRRFRCGSTGSASHCTPPSKPSAAGATSPTCASRTGRVADGPAPAAPNQPVAAGARRPPRTVRRRAG